MVFRYFKVTYWKVSKIKIKIEKIFLVKNFFLYIFRYKKLESYKLQKTNNHESAIKIDTKACAQDNKRITIEEKSTIEDLKESKLENNSWRIIA